MQSLAGNGYTLFAEQGIFNGSMRDGLLLVIEGRYNIATPEPNSDQVYLTGEGAEFLGPISVSGHGTLAYVQAEHSLGLAPTIRRRKPILTAKNWGYELEVPNDEHLMQLKLLHVVSGHRTSEQYHVEKDEVQIFLDHSYREAHYAPGQIHRVSGPAHYVEASTYHPTDVVRVSDDYGRA